MVFFYHNPIINYLIDIYTCRVYSFILRLNIYDWWILAMCGIVSTASIVFSFIVSRYIFLIYILSMVVCLMAYLSIRKKMCRSQVKDDLEVVRYDFDDTDEITTVVGSWKGMRNYMEDIHVVCPINKLFSVFDGHGGINVAKYIQEIINQRYEDIFHNLLINNNYHDTTKLTIDALESTLISLDTYSTHLHDRGGAVGAVVKIEQDKIYCSSIGDTESYMYTIDGVIHRLSEVHSITTLSEYCRYMDAIYPCYPRAGAVMRTKAGLIPTRSIGDHNRKRYDLGIMSTPETNVFNLTTDWKVIVIGSDGIWDCVSPSELKDLIDTIIVSCIDKRDGELDNKKRIDTIHSKASDLITRIQSITMSEADIIDKITGRYYGDNCTLMMIFNNKYF